MHDVRLLQQTAEAAARAGGAVLRDLFERPREVRLKGPRDLVTDADNAAQRAVTGVIGRAFPDHGYLTEEEDSTLSAAGDVIWVIDPLDGTSNYSRQQPNFVVSVGAIRRADEDKRPPVLAAAIYDPIRGELFSAGRGLGSTLNERPLHVSAVGDLAEAIFALDVSHLRARRLRMIELVTLLADDVHTLRAIGSAALALAWVAAGRLDAYANMSLGPWDVAAGELLIAEAGGALSGLTGAPWRMDEPGCIASNGRLHARLVDLVARTGGREL